MEYLSNRLQKMAESETLAMARKCRELKSLGHDVINLSIGEPDFNTPEFIKQAAKEAIDKNYSHYPPVAGYADLQEVICKKLKRDNKLDYKPNQVVVSTGAKQAIANVLLVLLNPGDEVLVPVPYWVSYKELIKLAEAKPVFIPSGIEKDFKVTAQQIEEAITPRTKMMIFSSPCNPSGSVYSRKELAEIASVIAKYPDIFVVSDEIYELINFGHTHESIAQFENIAERVIVINGVSKGFAMTGWRLGYSASSAMVARACDKLQGQITSATCSISQRAAMAALLADPLTSANLIMMRQTFQKRRDLLIGLTNSISGMRVNRPAGAFYLFPDVSAYYGKTCANTTIRSCEDITDFLLSEAYVALVPGSAFGDPDCIRISYATSEDKISEAMKRIAIALAKLK